MSSLLDKNNNTHHVITSYESIQQQQQQSNTLLHLPECVQRHILSYCTLEDMIHFILQDPQYYDDHRSSRIMMAGLVTQRVAAWVIEIKTRIILWLGFNVLSSLASFSCVLWVYHLNPMDDLVVVRVGFSETCNFGSTLFHTCHLY